MCADALRQSPFQCARQTCLRPSGIERYTGAVPRSPRRFVTRACEVCEWTGASIESHDAAVDCPWCHAPSRIVREEWLFDVAELKRQAAEFGRLGGRKGGRIRAERLSAKRRRDIARAAAEARWRRR